MSPAGRVQWQVPAKVEEATADVIVSITDATGQECLHNFTLSVE